MATRQLAAMAIILAAVSVNLPGRAHATCISIGNAYQCGTYYYAYDYYYNYNYVLLPKRAYFGNPVGYPTPFSGAGWIYRKRRSASRNP